MTSPGLTLDQRFWLKVDFVEGGCWIWTASTNKGYGAFHVHSDSLTTKTYAAHRWAYERYVGTVPDGLDLDHLCRTRACVRMDHLEPVTRSENLYRSLPFGNIGKHHKDKRECPQGHPYSGNNLRIKYRTNTRGDLLETRHCRACQRAYKAARRERARVGIA